MNLMTKPLKHTMLLLICLALAPSLLAQEEYRLNKSLVRGLANAYSHLQQLHSASFFQEALDGVIVHIYPQNLHKGLIEIYDISPMNGKDTEQLIITFSYDLYAPAVIYNNDVERILPMNFYGEMGPILIAYHLTNTQMDLIWFADNQATLIESINGSQPRIRYMNDHIYQITYVNNGTKEWPTQYFNTKSMQISSKMERILSSHEESYQAILLNGKVIELITYLDNRYITMPLDMEEFTADDILSIEWRIPEGEDWGHIVIEYSLASGGKSRAFYHSQNGMRLYF